MSVSRIQVVNRRRGVPSAAGAWRCRRKFLHFFPDAFRDNTYRAWERDYKWQAHQSWNDSLGEATFRSLLRAKEFPEIAMRAVRLESKTNLLFSFEKIALRDAVKSLPGATFFARALSVPARTG